MAYFGRDNVFSLLRSVPRAAFIPRLCQIAAFLFLALVYFVWTWSHELGDFGGDNAYYLLMSRHFSPWGDYSPAVTYFASHNPYPPLYPMILALFGGAENLLLAHLVTTTLLLFALGIYYAWQRALGLTALVASLCTLLFALLPGTYMQALSVLSENLYLFLTLVSLASVTAFEITRRTSWLLTAAIFVALAVMTRSAGISLLGAFVVYLMLHRPSRLWLYAAIAVIPPLLWGLYGGQESPGYLSSLIERYGHDPLTALSHQFLIQTRILWHGWIDNFTVSPVGSWVMAAIGMLSLLGMSHRILLRKFDGFYSAIYLLLILIWPFPAEAQRLLFVVVPVLLLQGLLLLSVLPQVILGQYRMSLSYMTILAIALVVAPSLLLTAKRFLQPLPEELSPFKHSAGWYAIVPAEAVANVTFSYRLVQHMRSIGDQVPPEACVYGIKPSLVGFYVGRKSLAPPREKLDDQAFYAALRDGSCKYFYLMGFISPSYASPYYPLQRLGDSLRVLSVAEPQASPVALLTVWIDQ